MSEKPVKDGTQAEMSGVSVTLAQWMHTVTLPNLAISHCFSGAVPLPLQCCQAAVKPEGPRGQRGTAPCVGLHLTRPVQSLQLARSHQETPNSCLWHLGPRWKLFSHIIPTLATHLSLQGHTCCHTTPVPMLLCHLLPAT